MKNIYILGLFLALFALNTSCDDDGGTSAISTTNGALPDFKMVAGSPDFIDLTGIANLNLQFTVGVGVGEPTSFDLKAYYLTVDGEVYGPITLDAGVTEFPKEYSFSGTQIIAAFSELNSAADIQVGDVLKFFTSYTFADGSKLEVLNSKGEPNYYAADFNTYPDFTVKLDYVVSCLSDLGGTHTYVTTNLQAANSDTPCPDGEVTGTVTWTDLGGGNYLTSDLGFGQYESSCWSDGPATSGGATFSEVCGEIISGGLDQYGLEYTWVITDVNGPELTMTWTNDYDDSGEVVITREGGLDWPQLFTK
tara:strand:+ start:2496 stop:3416 length:921 start_codon:yes stop_codon:yes gene_type:complete